MTATTATKKTLSVTLPDGTVATRTTARTYSHIIASKFAEGYSWNNDTAWNAWSFHGTEAAALKALASLERKHTEGIEFRVIAIETPAPVEETPEVAEVAETPATETPEVAIVATRTVVAHVDLTAPGRGIILVQGTAASASPQALLGREGTKWYVTDEEWGITIYRSSREVAVRAYLRELSSRYLGFNVKTVEIRTEREY